MILRRRELLDNRCELPVGYKRCKYLIYNGTYENHRIDTGIYWYKAKTIMLRVQILEPSTNKKNMLFASEGPTPPWICYDGTTSGLISFAQTCTPIYTATFETKSQRKIYLSGWSDNVWAPLKWNTSQLRIFDKSNNILFDGIPAIDPSGRPCMYDTVTKQPFYNLGNGEFGYELLDGTYVAPA